MLNNVTLCGRTTTDIELKATPNGKSVATFTLAVERDFSNNGEKETDFFSIVVWGKTAEFASKYFPKGSMMTLGGRLQNRSYTDKDGNKRYVTEVVASNIYFCGSKESPAEASRMPSNSTQSSPYQVPTSSANSSNSPYSSQTVAFEEMTGDDDLPF